MTKALMWDSMSPELLTVAERAKREPEGRFHALAHLIDVPALTRAYRRLRRNAAVGVDGITKEQYGQELERNLQDLHHRLKTKRYRHQPILRGYVPKGQGRHRPIGISATEDKVVQGALRDVWEAIYETEVTDSSYGFRPKRGAHDALRTLNRAGHGGEMNWIVEADIVSYFDSVDRTKLKEMIQKRVADGALMRLIGKCLNVGVLDGEGYSEPDVTAGRSAAVAQAPARCTRPRPPPEATASTASEAGRLALHAGDTASRTAADPATPPNRR